MAIDQLNQTARELRTHLANLRYRLACLRTDQLTTQVAIEEAEAKLAEVVEAKAAYWQQVNTIGETS